ncbi:MAG TPA: hypothetical protein VJZ26_03650 [Blastocatellia bacterium]|nr:hypothetical protein [Blastocatellia bacterium]
MPDQLRYYERVRRADDVLAELGEWMGAKVFGAVGEKLLDYEQSPACIVQVRVPHEAQNLLFRPFELAHLSGKPLAERGFRLIYTVAHKSDQMPGRAAPKQGGKSETLRMLGVFSLPRDATPLNLRQERYRLQQMVCRFAQKRGRAVELRLLQYGATRQLLQEVLQEAPGWDAVHFSGHGLEGELILEKPDGAADRIDAEVLAKLLRPARERLKLLTLSACYSGAADVRAARAQIGLENPPTRETAPAQTVSVLPSLGQRLAEELDCAVLAMRYPVLDDFATELALTLYDRMLEKSQPLPQALQLALSDALSQEHNPHLPTFSRVTPLLFGARAAELSLQAPIRPPSFELPPTGLFHFPPVPERFAGRLMPMLKASQALAPESDKTGVMFHGMAGAGKTACALELAYNYDTQNLQRFTAFVWHKAPNENHDIADALTQFALSLENQLPGLQLVGMMDAPEDFKRQALPRLRGLMQNYAILLVLDNLEGLLTASDGWRDPRWGELINALLDHTGVSRLVITSRRLPNALVNHPRLQVNAIHALSFQESVILGRELPHLKELFKDEEGREKLQRILRAAQGHPKLLELADAMAADAKVLEEHLARAESASGGAETMRMAFFESGQSDRPADEFTRELRLWTEGVAQNLSPTAQLLAQFLARLEDADRTLNVAQHNWEDFLKRLTGERGEEKQPAPEPAYAWAQGALSEPGLGFEHALNQLAQAGLIEIETVASQGLEITSESLQTLLPILAAQNPEVAAMMADLQGINQQALLPHIQAALANPSDPALLDWINDQRARNTTQQFRIHPGVAEALLLTSPPFVSNAVDIELGNYFKAMFYHGIKTEMQGGGRLVVEGARRAAPYLLRAQRWREASPLLDRMIARDQSPAMLALAIPLLRYIAEQTLGTENELIDAGVLANALLYAGRYAEAEQMQRGLIARCVGQDNYWSASVASGYLFNLLLRTGRFEEALQTAEETAYYTRRAKLGPWTQLMGESMRLQALNALGRHAEVLRAVEQLRAKMKELPEQSAAEESAEPWNVREMLLDSGGFAAMNLGRWETALALNADIVEHTRKRGANEVKIAQTRFNDYGPLLRLRRYSEARALLEYCRGVFERENSVYQLSAVYTALADLEDKEGRPASAVRFERTALRYKYQVGHPESCAISHNNLAQSIMHAEGGVPDAALAHMLADAVICFQIGSGGFATSIRSLARSILPPAPPSFAEVCAIVEQVEGVRFQALFAQLPKRAPDGDTAIQIVWQMAEDEAEKMTDQQAQIEAALSSLPEAMREAYLARDGEKFKAAFAQLTPEQQQQVMAVLNAGAGQSDDAPEQEAENGMQEVLRNSEMLLQIIAAVARGNSERRAEVEALLPQLEENGWLISNAVQRIWAGERDADALTAGLDKQDAALVRRVLEIVETS